MKLKISNQQVEIIEALSLVSDTENVYEAEYDFDDEWEGYQRTAVFEGCGATYQVVLTNTNKCKVPNEIVAESGYVRFGVLGTKVEGSITLRYPTVWSKKVWVDVASVGTGTPQPPTAEVYAQILANEDAIEDRLDTAEDDIEALEGSVTSLSNRMTTAEGDITSLEGDVAELESGKVDKVEGMGLSHNDYSDNEKSKVADAYAKRHEHSNKEILDAISQVLVDAWNNSVTWIANNGTNLLNHLSNGTIHVTASDKSTWSGKQNHLTAGENITIVNDVISASGGGGGTSDFEQLTNRPKYNGSVMDKNTDIPLHDSAKQDVISDLETIRSGSSLGATALQSVPNTYRTSADQDTIDATLQPKTDNLLSTTSKNIVGAINEVDSIALGANQALGVANYQTLVTMMNGATASAYRVGQNIYVQTLNVPDVWVYSVESSSVPYTYTTDEALATALDSGAVQMGYYKISKLEGQKVDLTNYVQKTNYATGSTSGVVITNSYYGAVTDSDGYLKGEGKDYSTYTSDSPATLLVSKSTLENVITGKGLVSNTDYASTAKGGVIKTHGSTGVNSNGTMYCNVLSYASYPTFSDYGFISKGTLENVLDNESIRIDKTQSLSSAQKSQAYTNLGAVSSQGVPIATSISSSSTHNEIPSAKAVYDFVMSLMG